MKLPVLIFDFGNVVCFFDYPRCLTDSAGGWGKVATKLAAYLYERGAAELGRKFEARRYLRARLCRAGPGVGRARGCSLRGIRDRMGRHLHPERTGRPADRDARGARIHTVARLQYQLLHADFFRRKFAATLDQFDHVGPLLRGRPDQARSPFFDACARCWLSARRIVHLHRRHRRPTSRERKRRG